MNIDMSVYLSGEKLYGDDFTYDEIVKWFDDEKEGYANLGAGDKSHYRYVYHQLNDYHGFRHLDPKDLNNVLGLGSAYGDEFQPVINHIKHITILDPSDAFADVTHINNVSCRYVRPNPSGTMPFTNQNFDLITSFGVLHHIPNVSHVLTECYRCLKPQKFMLIREPIVSMGDWTKPRLGMTKRERGIPFDLFRDCIIKSGFKIQHQSFCFFHFLPYLTSKLKFAAYNNALATRLDSWLCRIFASNTRYHRTSVFHKFGPSSIFFVLQK